MYPWTGFEVVLPISNNWLHFFFDGGLLRGEKKREKKAKVWYILWHAVVRVAFMDAAQQNHFPTWFLWIDLSVIDYIKKKWLKKYLIFPNWCSNPISRSHVSIWLRLHSPCWSFHLWHKGRVIITFLLWLLETFRAELNLLIMMISGHSSV